MKTVKCGGDEQLKRAEPGWSVASADSADTLSAVVVLAQRTGSLCVCLCMCGKKGGGGFRTMSYLFSTGCFLSAAVIDWKQPRQALHSEHQKHTPEFPQRDQHELHTDRTRENSHCKKPPSTAVQSCTHVHLLTKKCWEGQVSQCMTKILEELCRRRLKCKSQMMETLLWWKWVWK